MNSATPATAMAGDGFENRIRRPPEMTDLPHEPGAAADGAPGLSTRSVHAGLPAAAQGEPLLPGPVLAAPYHLQGAKDAAPYAYGRDQNPTWTAVERALGGLDAAEAVLFSSGMAAVSALLEPALWPGDVLVAVRDGYPGVRRIAEEKLAPRGVEVRFVATDTEAIVAACPGAAIVWVETPSNPALAVCDLAVVADAAHAAGARLVVDNTLCTPLGQRPLELGADAVAYSASKALSGHSDLVLGCVTTRDGAWAAQLRAHRSMVGSIAGPFEAWLLHRSLPTLALRLRAQSANALALAHRLREHPDVLDVRHPGLEEHPQHALAARQMALAGPLVGFTLADAERAQRFLGALELVAEATSFGGVHSTAERRARWGTDDVPDGFIRFSAGVEDAADLIADVEQALRKG
jgi:cystathionine gamma-lyase